MTDTRPTPPPAGIERFSYIRQVCRACREHGMHRSDDGREPEHVVMVSGEWMPKHAEASGVRIKPDVAEPSVNGHELAGNGGAVPLLDVLEPERAAAERTSIELQRELAVRTDECMKLRDRVRELEAECEDARKKLVAIWSIADGSKEP